MSLPAPLLAAVDQHACFSGHYRSDSEIQACTDPALPTARLYTVSCGDCLSFRPGVFVSMLPVGMTSTALADALSAHVRSARGYVWSNSGYFTSGSGFWLSAAYFGDGFFLVDASRNRNGTSDVDMLIEAFRRGVLQPEDARMLDPALYAAETGYVNMAAPHTRIKSKQDLLASPHYSARLRLGFSRVSLLEFLPLTMSAGAPAPAVVLPPVSPPAGAPPAVAPPAPPLVSRAVAVAAAAPPSPPQKLSLGDVCSMCGAEVKERPLFSGTFIGCLC